MSARKLNLCASRILLALALVGIGGLFVDMAGALLRDMGLRANPLVGQGNFPFWRRRHLPGG